MDGSDVTEVDRASSSADLRARYNGFIARHLIAWELLMGVLAMLWVAVGFMGEQYGFTQPAEAVEVVLWLVFAAEFGSRLTAAYDRRAYLRSHWIDAITLIPVLTGFRLLRLIRLVRLVRAFAGVYRAAMQVQQLAMHRGFAALLAVWLTVVVISSMVVYAAENGGPRALIQDPFDALWWGVTTITTVGYGDVYPQTPEGRLGAMVLMVLGIGLFSAITATITSFILSAQEEDRESTTTIAGQLETIAELHERGGLSAEEFVAAKALILKTNADRRA